MSLNNRPISSLSHSLRLAWVCARRPPSFARPDAACHCMLALAIVNCRLACYRFGLEETYGSDLTASRCPLVTWSLNTQRTLTRLYLSGAAPRAQSPAASQLYGAVAVLHAGFVNLISGHMRWHITDQNNKVNNNHNHNGDNKKNSVLSQGNRAMLQYPWPGINQG